MAKRDPYQILGVSRTASRAEIEAAHKKLAMQYHPDRNPNPDATTRMQDINWARDVLLDPQRRQIFEAEQRAQSAQQTYRPPYQPGPRTQHWPPPGAGQASRSPYTAPPRPTILQRYPWLIVPLAVVGLCLGSFVFGLISAALSPAAEPPPDFRSSTLEYIVNLPNNAVQYDFLTPEDTPPSFLEVAAVSLTEMETAIILTLPQQVRLQQVFDEYAVDHAVALKSVIGWSVDYPQMLYYCPTIYTAMADCDRVFVLAKIDWVAVLAGE